jgi:hypothetical protein
MIICERVKTRKKTIMLHNLIHTMGDPMVNTIHRAPAHETDSNLIKQKSLKISAKWLLVCMGLDWCEAPSKCKKYINNLIHL